LYTFAHLKCARKISRIEKNLDIHELCIDLCNIDNNFLPHELWNSYYSNVKNLNEIIKINPKKRKFKVNI